MQILMAWLLADFLTGFIHWWEDRFLSESTAPWLASVARDNDLHHSSPEAMGKLSAWENIRDHAWVGWVMALVAWALGAPLWLWLAFFFASFGNLVHRWSHVPRSRVPAVVRALQRTGLFISAAHHAVHHRRGRQLLSKRESGVRYCPMTNWLNPALDRMGFWRRIEAALSALSRVRL